MTSKTEAVWVYMERLQAEIAREIRTLLSEEPYEPRIFTAAERERRIEALKLCFDSAAWDDAARHDDWMKMHAEQGWTYGPELIPAEKKHPNMLPWNDLPQSTRSKARIFALVADYAGDLVSLVNSP